MKVIARQDYGYVVEVSKTEMMCITGVIDNYGSGQYAHREGSEIEISKAWRSLESIVAAPKQIKSQAEALRGLAAILDATSELVERTQALAPVVPPPAPQQA